MKRQIFVVAVFCILSVLIFHIRATYAAGSVGNGTSASCTENALLTAVIGGGTISFNCGQSSNAPVTILLTAPIALTSDTIIDGGAPNAIILSSGDTGEGERNGIGIFFIHPGVSVQLRNLQLFKTGNSAILNQGTLTLDNVEIQAARALQCAGIQSSGSLFLRNKSLITTNFAEAMGGGICLLGGSADLDDSDIRFNSAEQGGGIYIANNAVVESRNSYIAANQTTGAGAGIYVSAATQLTLDGTALVDNIAAPNSPAGLGGAVYNAGETTLVGVVFVQNQAHDGGGFYNSGLLTVRGSDIEQNSAAATGGTGGGFYNSGTLSYTTSSLVNNSADSGGGFYSSGNLIVANSTLANNTATSGGNLVAGGTTEIIYSTLSANSPQALAVSGGDTTVLGSIVEGCTANNGSLTSNGYNLDLGNSCAFAQGSDQINTDPLLGLLQQIEGRLTWHRLPLTGSPAIDSGAATCAEANAGDQHQASRPAGAACDIGAVGVGGVLPTPTVAPSPTITTVPNTSPTATASRTATSTPITPTFVTATPTPEGPYIFPAPAQGTATPGIALSPNHGAAGDEISVQGSGLPGDESVQLMWAQFGVTFAGVTVPLQNDDSYQATLRVPAEAAAGAILVCAVSVADPNGRFGCADFTVDPPAAGQVNVVLPAALPANATVNLVDHAGTILYSASAASQQLVSAAGGGQSIVSLAGVSAGAYHIAVIGATYALDTVQVASGKVSVGTLKGINGGLDPITRLVCDADVANVSLVQAKFSYAGFYSNATANLDPPVRQADGVMESNWINRNVGAIVGKAPQAEFGTFLSGVFLTNEFRARVSGLLSAVQRVEYWVRGAGQANWTKIGESASAPYAIPYNVGNLPPGDAELVVAPVVDGARQCSHKVKIKLIADPMKESFIRFGLTTWDGTRSLYVLSGRLPNLPEIPAIYPENPDPYIVDPLGDVGSKFDAGVTLRGEMALNQVMRFTHVMASSEVKVLGFTPEYLNRSFDLLPGGAILVNPNNPSALALHTGRMKLGNIVGFSFNSPKIVVFSYFGLVNAYVSFSFGLDGELYFESIIYPLQPALDLRLEPQARASFGVRVGADVLFGLVDASVEVGVTAALGLPFRIYAAATPEVGFLSPRLCLSAYIQFHWSVLWGVFGDSSDRKPFFRIPSGCQTVLASMMNEVLPPHRILASPALAGDSTGRMVSVYIEDATPDQTSAAPQVLARTWNLSSQSWDSAVALSEAGAYVASPSVTMFGDDGRALAAWVQSTQSAAESNTGDFSAALTHMEIYTAFFDGSTWSAPVALTSDNLPAGNPTLAGDGLGATLAWVHHVDGDLSQPGGTYIAVQHWNGTDWSPVELLSGSDTTTGANPVSNGARLASINSQPSVARTVVNGDAEVALAWTFENAGNRRVVVAHSRGQVGAWYMLDTTELPAQSSAAVVTIPAGQSRQLEVAFTVAIPDPDGESPNLGNMANIWTAQLTDLDDRTDLLATPLRDENGQTVRGEKPELQLADGNERLLTFRRFGKPGTDSEWGQLAVAQAADNSAFVAPLNLTQGEQHWQGAALVNGSTNRLTMLGVQVSQLQTPVQASQSLHADLVSAQLSSNGNPLLALEYPADADPALVDGLQVTQLHMPAGSTVIVSATVRNLGRNESNLQIRWWAGQPGSGTLLATSISATIGFNGARVFTQSVTTTGNAQPISAQIVTAGSNRLTTNDRAMLDIGALPAPSLTSVGPTTLYNNALLLAFAPSPAPEVAGYRILRRLESEGSFTLAGETIGLQYYDAGLVPGQRYCYAVQAYDAAGALSNPSTEQCSAAEQTGFTVHLPLVQR